MRWRRKTDSPASMDWMVLAGSLAAILALAALVHLLKLGGAAIEDGAHAMRLAEDNLSGFKARKAVISEDGEAAIVLGDNAKAALIKRHGAQFAMREVAVPLALKKDGEAYIVDSGEMRFGRITLSLAKADADKLLTWV